MQAAILVDSPLCINPGYRWIQIKIGGSDRDSISIYALSRFQGLDKVRDVFFERYIFPAYKETVSTAENSGGHASLANSVMRMGAKDAHLRIGNVEWRDFWLNLSRLVEADQNKKPLYFKGVWAGVTMHGLKRDLAHVTGGLEAVLRSKMIVEDLHKADLVQVHLAVTFQQPGQTIVADFERVRSFFPSSYRKNMYESHGLMGVGNFTHAMTSRGARLPGYREISYVQFYGENYHLLKKGISRGHTSLFMDALIGYASKRARQPVHSASLKLHCTNVEDRKTQFNKYIQSLRRGVTARFEAVFDYPGARWAAILNNTNNGNIGNEESTQQHPVVKLQRLFKQMCHHGIFKVSVGDFWQTTVLGDFEDRIFPHYVFQFENLSSRTETPRDHNLTKRSQLIQLWDLEQIVHHWCCGSFCRFLDLRRCGAIKKEAIARRKRRPDEDSGSGHIKMRPIEDQKDPKHPQPRLATLGRFGYNPTLVAHAQFILSMAPRCLEAPPSSASSILDRQVASFRLLLE